MKWINSFITYQGTSLLGASGVLYDVANQYDARLDLIPGWPTTAQGWANQVAAFGPSLKAIADATLGDLQTALDAPNSSVSTILPLLYNQMVADGQTVQQCSAISATPAAGSNHGNGVLHCSVTNVKGVSDERIIPETVVATCASDQWSGGTAGSESFPLVGNPKLASAYVSGTRGSGNGPTFTPGLANNKLTNGSFSTFAAGLPTGWTEDAGGALISQETTLFHSPSGAALKLSGDGATTAVTLHQNVSLLANTIYHASVWLRKSGTVNAGSTLTVQLTGTGTGPFVLFSGDPATLTASYVLSDRFLTIPGTFGSDSNLQITWTNANLAGASAVLLVDDVALIAPASFAGVQYALIRGSVDFAVGDSFTVTTNNNFAGVFQTFFGRFYNFQLPSSGSPTINDSLAQ